jgi:amino acid transporter
MPNTTSQHILNTSANLLGFCLFVITSLHITNTAETTKIDEFTSVIALLLTFSCMFSFISIRTKSPKRELRFETIADYLFMASLIGILIIILLITLNFAK